MCDALESKDEDPLMFTNAVSVYIYQFISHARKICIFEMSYYAPT